MSVSAYETLRVTSMDTTFSSYLSNSLFFAPEQMYGENKKIFEELPYIVKGNIYFLVKRRKVRVLPSSIGLSDDGYISVTFTRDDGVAISARFPFAPTVLQLGTKFVEIYENADTLQQYVVGVRNQCEYLTRQRFTADRPFIGVSLDGEAQNKNNIALCLHTPDAQVIKLAFSVHSILSAFEIDIGDYPLVLYIGKSKHLKDRIYRHEKIQQALSIIGDDSDLYLYAFQFDTAKCRKSYLPDKTLVLRKDYINDVDAKDQLAIIEMCLINYFKPKLNEKYKDCEIPLNDVYQTALKGRYSQVLLEVDYDGNFWNFGTEHIAAKLRHEIKYPVYK